MRSGLRLLEEKERRCLPWNKKSKMEMIAEFCVILIPQSILSLWDQNIKINVT